MGLFSEGAVTGLDGLVLAQVLHKLGAGRSKAGEPINHSVGAELLVSFGQKVEKGGLVKGNGFDKDNEDIYIYIISFVVRHPLAADSL